MSGCQWEKKPSYGKCVVLFQKPRAVGFGTLMQMWTDGLCLLVRSHPLEWFCQCPLGYCQISSFAGNGLDFIHKMCQELYVSSSQKAST